MISLRELCLGMLALVLAVSATAAADDLRCGGSEGPKPINEFPQFKSDAKLLSTKSTPQEFVLWEKAKRVVYRNSDSEIYATDLDGANEELLSTSSKPLLPFSDPAERYLTTRDDTWVLDAWNGPNWIHHTPLFEYPQHLFWNRDWLYSITSFYDLNGQQNLRVSKYQAGASQAVPLCEGVQFKPGNGFHVGEGHQFPYIYLYRTLEENGESVLHLYRMKIAPMVDLFSPQMPCTIKDLGEYSRKIEGRVESVHWFNSLRHIAVKVKHPQKNLMWSTGTNNGCRYFNIGENAKPLILNHEQAVIATVENGQMRLVYLGDEEALTADVAKSVPISSLSQGEVQLTKNGRTLFLVPTLPDQSRGLLRIELPAKH